jgi:hypothetical protein
MPMIPRFASCAERGNPLVSYLHTLDEQKRQLEKQHPRWQVWYVPRVGQPAVWHARMRPTLNEETPEQLSEAIAHAEDQLMADVRQTDSIERGAPSSDTHDQDQRIHHVVRDCG